jgi:hypothetical protein
MHLTRLARLARLEEADLAQEGQTVTLRIQYAGGPDGSPPTWGPSYTYRLGAGERLWEETTDET